MIYTHHSVQSAASTILRIIESQPRTVIIGFDANGAVTYGYSGIGSLPELVIIDEYESIWDNEDWYPEGDVLTDDERQRTLDVIEWHLSQSDGIAFECPDEEIDLESNSATTQIRLERDNDRGLVFNGYLVASVESQTNNAHANYSGMPGRWFVLSLYRTDGGKFVCERVGRTVWNGEHDRHQAHVAETPAEVIAFFGLGWLSKQLYDGAEIAYDEVID